jgi:hypothetical protein
MVEASKQDKVVVPIPDDLVESLAGKLGGSAEKILPYQWMDSLNKRKRLARMGISTPEELRMACREFLQYREAKKGIDRAVALERALVGNKHVGTDFFPTPKELCARMVEIACNKIGFPDRVSTPRFIEPSGGNGNIAEAIRAIGVEPDVVEISSSLREILEAKKFSVIGHDFLDVTGEFDCFCMNPPFGNNADILHVQHAYSLLAPAGVIVAIVGAGAFFRSGSVEQSFRDWLDEIGAEIEDLPDGTFTDRTLMATTGASAKLVTIVKA